MNPVIEYQVISIERAVPPTIGDQLNKLAAQGWQPMFPLQDGNALLLRRWRWPDDAAWQIANYEPEGYQGKHRKRDKK